MAIFAAADIGSNTAHVLVADSDGRTARRLANQNEWISLGEVVSRTGQIGQPHQKALISAIANFRNLAASHGAKRLYVFATEAMRKASNHAEVVDKIRRSTGIPVDIITPDLEAELSLHGAKLDTNLTDVKLLFEVGGGSAQIAHIEDGRLVDDESVPLGTGAMIVKAGLTNPCDPSALALAEEVIQASIRYTRIEADAEVAVASGGVARGLWRALHPDGEKSLFLEELDYMVWAATHLTTDQLIRRFSVKQKRAATLLPGALVFRALARHHGVQELRVSEYGIREGAVLQMAQGIVAGWDVG